jgi:hypothetical protein
MNNVNLFYSILNTIGIPLTPESPSVLIFACAILSLAIICFLSFINILFYLASIYVLSHDVFLSRLPNWPLLLKVLNFYKSTRVAFIVFESWLLCL